MDFRFDKDDSDIVTAARDAMAHAFGPARLTGGDSRLDAWRAVAADGWLHAGLDEELGGQVMPLYLLAAIAREAGRALCVDEWCNNALLLPALIAGIEASDVRAEWLARHRARPGFLVMDGRRLSVTPSDDLRSEWCFGVDAGFDAYGVRTNGAALHLVRVQDAALAYAAVADLALGVGSVGVTGGSRVEAKLNVAAEDLDQIASRAALVHAAGLVGLAEVSEASSVEYVKIRQQFGQPVGRFQALKHILADVHVQNEIAWNACLYAALVPAEKASLDVARLQAVEAALHATRSALQLHGGVGFTWESDVHFALKIALAGGQRFGGREQRAAAIGRALLESSWI